MHQIGVGVLGPVYRTYEPAADRLVSVKAFDLDITPEQIESLVESLNRLVTVDLSHRGLVAPIAAGLEGDTPYLAQEYVAAESLDVAIRHYAPASLDAALPFITGIAEAVDVAHEFGIVHGTLHLRDIFVSPEEVRITGFWIATALEAIGLAVPIRRPYTAPEVIAGRAWGGEADLYTVAAVAYELLTGRGPAGSGDQVADRLQDVAGATDPDALRAAFVRALADAPEERFSSGAHFVSALRAAGGDDVGAAAAAVATIADEVDDTEETDGAGEIDIVEEVSFTPAGGAVPPDLLSGLDLYHAEPAAEVTSSSADPAVGRVIQPETEESLFEGGLTEVSGEVDEDGAEKVESSWASESAETTKAAEGDVSSDDQFDAVAVTDDVSVPSDDYVPFEVPSAEAETDDTKPSDEDEWATTNASFVSDSESEQPEVADLRDVVEPTYVYNNNDVDVAHDLDADAFGEEAVPLGTDDRHGASWMRSAAPIGIIALIVAVAAFFFGMGFGSDGEEPGDRVLGHQGGTETVDAGGGRVTEESVGDPDAARDDSASRVLPVETAVVDATLAPSQKPVDPGEPAVSDSDDDDRVMATASSTDRTPAPDPLPQPLADTEQTAFRRSEDGGWLLLRTEPPGATVLLNGADRGVTPLSLRDVSFGQHELEVRLAGFETAGRLVDIQPSAPVVAIGLELYAEEGANTPVRVAADPGSIVVVSRPAGATVVIDDEVVGVTPVTVPVPGGGHQVRMELDGYQVWSTTVDVSSVERIRVAASLERMLRSPQ